MIDDGYKDDVTYDGAVDSYSSSIASNYGDGVIVEKSPGTQFEITVDLIAIGGQYCTGVGLQLQANADIPTLRFRGTVFKLNQLPEVIEGEELVFSPYGENMTKFMSVRNCSVTV